MKQFNFDALEKVMVDSKDFSIEKMNKVFDGGKWIKEKCQVVGIIAGYPTIMSWTCQTNRIRFKMISDMVSIDSDLFMRDLSEALLALFTDYEEYVYTLQWSENSTFGKHILMSIAKL